MDLLTLWCLAVLAIGGAMYAVMSLGSPNHARVRNLSVRRPGWIARRRARGGIAHRSDRVGVGYASATSSVFLSSRELAHHGAVFGGPGSGKTTFLELLIEALGRQLPLVVVDPKGSPSLAAAVRENGGLVWTLDGRLPADLLDPRPWQVPDLLLEAEEYNGDARVYRDAAHQRALWAAWALSLRGEPMDLARLRALLDRTALLRALQPFATRDQRVAEWVDRLTHQHGGIEDSGARGLDRSLGTLLDGVAMRGSLSAGADAIRLEDVMATNGMVLFSLDGFTYPHATRKVASWVLLGMGRLTGELRNRPYMADMPSALLLVDEVGALGSSARHLRGLVGRARESGLAVVLATQGPSDLEAVDRSLLDQVLQDTGWQMGFRQGSPHDAQRMAALFGQAWVDDVTRWSDGRTSSRRVEQPRVSVDEWMNGLDRGDAWLRVSPVDRGWRQQRVRVALPSVRKQASETDSETMPSPRRDQFPSVLPAESPGAVLGMRGENSSGTRVLPPSPPECPQELRERMGVDILAKVEQREVSRRRELGPCLVWRDGQPTIKAAGNVYGRMYDPALKRSDLAHKVVWRRCYGPIPRGLEVDHRCDVTLCQRPDHLQLLSKRDNLKRRGPTRGPNKGA